MSTPATTPLGTPPIRLKCGLEMPHVGFGTWRMGETPSEEAAEIAALRRALERGFVHFDTAEMYGEGGAEEVLGRAIADVPRESLFLTSKVYPWHARADQVVEACERSLGRLGVDHLDLYLLHWPGQTPVEDTLEGARRLKEAGKIRAFGVSNFDVHEVGDLARRGLLDGIEVNQLMHNPARRGIEVDLLPLLEELGIACMAYTPIEPEAMEANPAFREIAEAEGLSPAALALAWHVTLGRTCPIPKSATPAHVDALAEAAARRRSGRFGVRPIWDVMARAHHPLRALVPLILAFALLLSGCGEVNDMLDAGAGKDKKKAAAAETEAASGGGSARAKLDAYYNRESRTVEHDPKDPIVSCNIRGKRQYMRRSDCALRGGHE